MEDAARAIVLATFTGFEGEIVWDETKPDWQPRGMLDVIRAEKEFGLRAKGGLRKG